MSTEQKGEERANDRVAFLQSGKCDQVRFVRETEDCVRGLASDCDQVRLVRETEVCARYSLDEGSSCDSRTDGSRDLESNSGDWNSTRTSALESSDDLDHGKITPTKPY